MSHGAAFKNEAHKRLLPGRSIQLSKIIFCFCFLDRAFSIMKTKINQQNAQINSGLIYY